jgi:signal transduction histidine kinase
MGVTTHGKSPSGDHVERLLIFAAILLVFITALSTRAWRETRNAAADQKPVISKTLLVGTYVVILIAVLFNRLPAVGLVPMQEGLLYRNLVYALVSSVMMMILVLVRAYRLNQRQQNAQKHLEMAQLEIAREQARRVEQSNFLKMLAHEMKTPLSVVRMAVGSEYPSPRINDMATALSRHEWHYLTAAPGRKTARRSALNSGRTF